MLGHIHIPQKYAPLINDFNKKHLIPYLNFHRPCYFSIEKVDKKGKIKKVYKYENMLTPYEKLKSLPNAKDFLKEGVTFDSLDKISMEITDLESAKQMKAAREKLFDKIFPTK